MTKRLYVSYLGGSGRGIWKFDGPNSGAQIVPTSSSVAGLAISTNSLLYVSESGNINRYTDTGTPFGKDGNTTDPRLVTPGDGGLSHAMQIAFGPDGNLYVANLPGGVVRFRPDGTAFGIDGSDTDGLFTMTGGNCFWLSFSPFRLPKIISGDTNIQIGTVDFIQRSEEVYRAISNACVILQTDPVDSTNYLAGLGISADLDSCAKLQLAQGTVLRIGRIRSGNANPK